MTNEPDSAKDIPASNRFDGAAQVEKNSACKATQSAADPNNWECTQCGLYGPWEGVICANCGTRAEEDGGNKGAGRG